MQESDKPQFVQLLTDLMGSYMKSFPEKIFFDAWWRDLGPFPLLIVAKAMLAYKDEDAKFAPAPVAIAKLCKLMDGRPGIEEAWAIALTAKDEADTVVWTQEIAEAFNLARLMIDKDELISARMMFKEAYTKLVSNARLNFKPVKWISSLGTDADRREDALSQAVIAGLLPVPYVAGLLALTAFEENKEVSHEGLEKVKVLMLTLDSKRIETEISAEQLKQIDRQRVADRKQYLQDQIEKAKS